MLSTGATVTAIEPQLDLSQLGWGTACVNGWGDRLTLYNNAVTTVEAEIGAVLALGNKEQDGAWGFRPDGSHGNKKTAKHFIAKKFFLEQVIAGTSSFEFVKVHHRARPFPLQDFSLKAPRGSPSVIIAQSLVISTLSDLFIFSIK